jgi:hypothetical protein
MFKVGDKVRTTKGSRTSDKTPIIKIVEVGRKWRDYDAVVGQKMLWNTWLLKRVPSKKHIYLVKNLVHV